MQLFKTKIVELQNHIKANPDDIEQIAVYKICANIIKEELEAIREEMRGKLSVYAPAEQLDNQIKFGIFKATDVEEVFSAYIGRIEDAL